MSHASGEVIIGDQIVGYFEYNGTCDVATTKIQPTLDAVHAAWRKANMATCTCGKPPVAVILWSSYGDGFHWPAKACLECLAIVENLTPHGRIAGQHEPVGYGEYASADFTYEPANGHPFREPPQK